MGDDTASLTYVFTRIHRASRRVPDAEGGREGGEEEDEVTGR